MERGSATVGARCPPPPWGVIFLTVKHRADIQGLRALAVLLVIFAHVGIAGFAGGWIGVDVFFVISGFLITGLLINEHEQTNHVSLVQFYLRRAKRILPASLITIVVVLIASNVLLNSIRTASIRTDALWSVGFASNINLIRQSTDYFASTAVSPLQHFWSLAVEEQFYLIWPALFLLVVRQHGLEFRLRPITRDARLIITAGVISVISLLWSISYSYSHPTIAYFSTLTRIWELGFGVLLAVGAKYVLPLESGWTERERRFAHTVASWGGIAAILLGACAIIKPGDAFPGYLALIPVLGAVGLLFGGLAENPPLPNRILSKQPLPFIGTISFSLYLWHWPVHVFAQDLYPDSADSTAGMAAQLAVILVISLVSYYAIENPARRIPVGKREPEWKMFAEISKAPRGAIAVMCVGAAFLFLVGSAATGGNVDAAEGAGESAGPIVTTTTTTTLASGTTSVPAKLAAPPTEDGPLLREWKARVGAAVSQKTVSGEVLKLIEATAGKRGTAECDRKSPPNGCYVGSGSNTVSILGDSHSEMLKPMLQTAFPTWQIHDYHSGNCGWSMIDFANPGQEDGKGISAESCSSHRLASLDEMLVEKPQMIVLSENSQWVLGQPKDQQQQWVDGLTATLDRVQQLSPTTLIVVFGEVPRSRGFEGCLRGSSISSCFGVPSESRWLRDQQRQATVGRAGVLFIDTEQWLCTTSICPGLIDETPVYADSQHFTGPIGVKLGPIFKEAVGL